MRCKACDKVLTEGEIIWLSEWHRWEDLCGGCKFIAFQGFNYYTERDHDHHALDNDPKGCAAGGNV